ncbi:valyl-tRNA synthetase [Methanosarcina mazei]|uniref:Valine--tRNA ligase n=1 Tax=Methanosarcina mazei TaxID=2209 RepID=A0A0F8S528_METMZ|nr:valine--tRNA ligase [Methanosarcina mazei]KKG05363.1 valyl-tRNA synthetase [Methanosarcina mazei]KKG05574.1 valyl-tRNA synthetase [Methanosarcina mazei]KKH33717.1 valyl-tRNA synthetase [Methanosarcina mazei]KKH39887.1 valyl-tRNA synthetase [Methanosarcina mazei]KKH51365.1 valyl-tRNA synthetase [Methanosarcina mazei]
MTESEIPKEYNANEVEKKWMEKWNLSMYHFNWGEDTRPQYIIDTPPPYPTGNFHIGNALNWCYIDFVARYKRMRGYNVMFPQGWDCHGLPTEVKVEETHGITKNQVPRAEFRRMCRELTAGNIDKMRQTMLRLGFSVDWSNEFVTMEPSYFVKTQKSFVRMYNNGHIYHEDHPVNWCPRCETAIAFAEVEYDQGQTKLNFVHFDKVDIATTRPELMAACVAVAVNPEDERYSQYIGKEIEVPLFGQKVTLIADEAVEPEFGTGAVMICTFGDKQDVRWWAKYGLPLIKAIDKQGRMTKAAGKYEGMSIPECRQAVISDLKTAGFLYNQKPLEQNVGLCWRCDTPIEILSEPQWFVKINHEGILKAADEINWYPEYMKVRLQNWTGTMEWDWCISRQRIFATPIPIWYCKKCGEVMIAEESWLPIDPNENVPKKACACGSTEFEPETDVLDTWMDSSITALHVSGWESEHGLRLPAQIRPQGHDIIRTWAFYTILRSLALEGKRPWDSIVINGMVLGTDGHKMSKSLGNVISPEEVTTQYSADAFRQWGAVGGSTGSDVMFRWKDVVSASRFLQKMWSIYRFSMSHLKDFDPADAENFPPDSLYTIDRWLLSKLNRLVESTTKELDGYQFDSTFKAIRGFAWEVLADNYLELVKGRLYGENKEGRKAAQYVLYTTTRTLSLLLAPFIPFFAEEMYSRFDSASVHTRAWPAVNESLMSEEAEAAGEMIKDITGEVRRYKSDLGMALNAPLKKIEIYNTQIDTGDIAGATNSEVELMEGAPSFDYVPVEVKPNMGILGPRFRKDAGAIVKALKAEDPASVEAQTASGRITVTVNGEKIELEPEAVEIRKEVISGGREVDVLDIKGAVVVIVR